MHWAHQVKCAWLVVALIATTLPDIAYTQSKPTPLESALLQISKERRRLMEIELELTEQEARGFWPIYDRFESELSAWRLERAEILAYFGEQFDDLDDDEVFRIIDRIIHNEEDRLKLARRQNQLMKSILPARKLMIYFQIEMKIHAYVEAGLADQIPLLAEEENKSTETDLQ